MADEADRLVTGVQASNQRLDALVGAQLVGAVAARDHQQVQVVGHQVGGRLIRDQLDPLLAPHGLSTIDADQADGGPRLLEAVVRVDRLGVLEQGADHHRGPLAGELLVLVVRHLNLLAQSA
jgi:hypothetical protein